MIGSTVKKGSYSYSYSSSLAMISPILPYTAHCLTAFDCLPYATLLPSTPTPYPAGEPGNWPHVSSSFGSFDVAGEGCVLDIPLSDKIILYTSRLYMSIE